MATDIWIHIEHRSRNTNKYVYDYEVEGDRVYVLFGPLAGTRGSCEAIYTPRGLPADVTPQTLRKFNDFGEEAHTPSWLTTKELRECMDKTVHNYANEYGEDTVRFWLKSYDNIYDYMKKTEDEVGPCRIVFWFDN